MHHARKSLQEVTNRHTTLAIERNKLLQGFLLRKDFSQFRAPTYSGPAIVLNAAESRCDALVVPADLDHVIHDPLPNFPFQ